MAFKYIPSKQVEVPDIPYKEEITLNPARTAMIIVDMQNDFVKPEGNLVVPAASDSVGNIAALLQRARQAGVQIVYTQDTMLPDDPEFDVWPEHAIEGTWGWEIISELAPREGDLICKKNRYNGFYGTWMDHFLGNVWDIEHLVIVGTVSNVCVLHTAASAGLRWYTVVVPANGITANTEFDQALTLHQVGGLYEGDVTRHTENIFFQSE